MGRAVFPPFCLTWGQTMVEVMKIMVTSFKRSHPNPAAGHPWPTPPLETPGHSSGKSVSVPWGCLLLFSGSWCTQGFVYTLQESVSPVLCKCWQRYGGVNGDLLQEGLCHTLVCCTQSPSEPLPLQQATDVYLHRRSQVGLQKYQSLQTKVVEVMEF